MIKKIVHAADNILTIGLYLLFTVILLTGVYFCVDLYHIFVSAGGGSILNLSRKSDDSDAGHSMPREAVAWITIDGSGVDYPVMQGTDNNVYLNTDPEGKYSLSGSIFLDFRNKSDFTDRYSVIYGHHMEYGLMFGVLDRFMEREFFESHKTGTLTVGGKKYPLNIFAAVKTDAGAACVFNPEDFNNTDELETYISENAEHLSDRGSGKIIALTTCSEPSATGRWAVFAEITG